MALNKEQYNRLNQMLKGTSEDRHLAIGLLKYIDRKKERVPLILLLNKLTNEEKVNALPEPYYYELTNKPISELFSECTEDYQRELLIERYIELAFGYDSEVIIKKYHG